METGIPRGPLPEADFWTQGLDRNFFLRAYRWSAILGAFVTLGFLGLEQRTVAMGVLCGVLTGMFSLWTVEVTVRLLFNGGKFAGLKLAIGWLMKLPFLGAGLLGIAWAGEKGFMNIFAVICGVLL